MSPPTMKLTVDKLVQTLGRLGDRQGSRYSDIRQALADGEQQPSLFHLKTVMARGLATGAIRRASESGKFVLGSGPEDKKEELVPSPSQLGRKKRAKTPGGVPAPPGKRRRSRRRKGKKAAKKGKKGKKGRGRRRRRGGRKGKGKKGKKSKKGKKGRGKRRRKGKKGKGKKGKKR